MPTRPLHGVRVLDLTTSVAGPYCTLVLAAFGADVVKVERPDGGDDTRAWGPPFWHGQSAAFLSMNAGKRSLALDLKAPAGRETALELAAQADVVVQNLRPGLAERLGLGFEAVALLNPRVVYCSIGAFGSRGPLATEPGYDPLMQAAAGIMSITGEPDGNPVRAGPSIVDQGTGLWSAIGILVALRAREAGAGPQLLDTSLYETAVNWLPYQIVGYLASGVVPGRAGSAISMLAPYQAFDASDGRLVIAAGNDRLFGVLCDALGAGELRHDARFRSNADRVANREALAAAIGAHVAEGTVADWLERLRAAGVPAAPVQDVGEVVASPQTAALGLLERVPHPDLPELELVALPLSLDGARLAHGGPPPATVGEHSEEVLLDAGFARERIDALVGEGIVAVPPRPEAVA